MQLSKATVAYYYCSVITDLFCHRLCNLIFQRVKRKSKSVEQLIIAVVIAARRWIPESIDGYKWSSMLYTRHNDVVQYVTASYINTMRNKSAQSNLGRGPRRGAVAHVRRKVPTGYNGAPQIRPQKYPYPWTDPQTHTCLMPGPVRPTYDAKRHPDPIGRFSTMQWTDRPTDRRTYVRTDRPTDRLRESLTTIGRCATRATRPIVMTSYVVQLPYLSMSFSIMYSCSIS